MKDNFEKIKEALKEFGHKYHACDGQYRRLIGCETTGEVIAVVRDNFGWCCSPEEARKDLATIIAGYREEFAAEGVYYNESNDSATYILADSATVRAYGSATVEAYDSAYVNTRSSIECKISGKAIVRYALTGVVKFDAKELQFQTVEHENE